MARLRPQHPRYQEFQGMLYRIKAGYAGELVVDRYLEKCNFMEPTHILTDVQLKVEGKIPIQLDTVIITRSSVTILEIKNTSAKLVYNPNPPHYECHYPNRPSIIMECPQMQVENSRHYLKRWLAEQAIRIPVQCTVVLANQKTAVCGAPPEMKWHYAKHLPLFFYSQPAADPVLTSLQLDQLKHILTSQQTTYDPFPLASYFKIDHQQLITGCICSSCSKPLRKASERKWRCDDCGQNERSATAQAIQDYFLLFGEELSNKKCREFLNVNADSARYIMKNFQLLKSGNGKSVSYYVDRQQLMDR